MRIGHRSLLLLATVVALVIAALRLGDVALRAARMRDEEERQQDRTSKARLDAELAAIQLHGALAEARQSAAPEPCDEGPR